GLGFKALRKTRFKGFEQWAAKIDLRWGDARTLVLLQALSCVIVVVALFLTQSRGAAGATFIACVVTIVTMASRPLTADRRNDAPSPWRGYAIAATGVLLVIGVFLLFAGRSAYRMTEQGSEDARWCAFGSTIAAIRDNWLLGTGFGAFQDVFPVYRDASCAGIFGVWERAHNVFLEGYLGLGLPFAVATVIAYGVMIGVLARGARARHRLRFIPVSALAALLLVSLHSLVDFSLQIPGLGAYFAAVMGAATTVSLGRKAGRG
ncbi:MAG: O-antigen ligase family protein, partial [Hyphomicrobiales bacterium]|nr:O-antigen ligase family protein [Hyphomicrobiales bacterium]